jgi:hypothetical protein
MAMAEKPAKGYPEVSSIRFSDLIVFKNLLHHRLDCVEIPRSYCNGRHTWEKLAMQLGMTRMRA